MRHTGLVIRKPDGSIGDVLLCNEKSRNKTLERGELWVVDAETRRVLPYNGGGARCAGGFTDRDRWFEISLADSTGTDPSPTAAVPPSGVSDISRPSLDTTGTK